MSGKTGRKRRYHLNSPVVVYITITVLVAVAAISTQRNLLFGVLGVLIAGLGLSLVITWLMVSAVAIRRLDPQHGAVGEPLVVRYRLVNRRRRIPLFNLHLAEVPIDPGRQQARIQALPEKRRPRVRRARPWQSAMNAAHAWAMHVAGHERTHAEAVFWPIRRGRVAFDRVRVWTSFPFGLVKKSVTISQPHTTLIFPQLHRLRPDVLQSVSASGPMGMRVSERIGKGDNFYGLREYRDGDSLRQISWKHSARVDELVSIDRSDPSPPKLRVIINLTRPTEELRISDSTPIEKRLAEERAISLAASIVYAADAQGYEVGLSILGVGLAELPVRRSHWHLGKLMAALAAIELDRPREPASVRRAFQSDRAGIIVVHPDRADPDIVVEEAWHLTAGQLEDLTTGRLGWDPTKVKHVPDPLDTPIAVPSHDVAAASEVAA